MSDGPQRIKPRTPPGSMELLPAEQAVYDRMLGTVRGVFERFGFLPIATPAIEFAEVLLGKEGGETAKQVYLVQSTGARGQGKDADLALRFDLTVPLARYVAEHEQDLAFPFRRMQIQSVFRGESAQKGRYREFHQCDVDVVGRDTLDIRHDAEMVAVIHAVFTALEVGAFVVHVNDRKVLRGFLTAVGVEDADLQTRVLREIDKIEKRGQSHLERTLCADAFGLSRDQVTSILDHVTATGSAREVLAALEGASIEDPVYREGVAALRAVVEGAADFGVPVDGEGAVLRVNPGIARGLDYYTGTVYETFLVGNEDLGSVCSGGRYDDLASLYSKSRLPGVGVSVGFTRLFHQLREAGLVAAPGAAAADSRTALILRLDAALLPVYARLATDLRTAGLPVEVFHDDQKLGKQMKYANRRGARFAILLGEDEAAAGTVTIRDLARGEQETVPLDEAAAVLRRRLAER